MIVRRDIPEELDMIAGEMEDMKMMEKFYKSLGVEPEVQDESYFSQALKGFVSEGEDEELYDSYQSRSLLSVKEEEEYEYCDKEDPKDCKKKPESAFNYVSERGISTTLSPKVSTSTPQGRTAFSGNLGSGLDRCRDFLERSKEFTNEVDIGNRDMDKMPLNQKVKAKSSKNRKYKNRSLQLNIELEIEQ